MNINEAKSPGRCARCGMTKMTIEGVMSCPNCSTENEPKTGRTIIVTETSPDINSPAKVTFVGQGHPLPPAPTPGGVIESPVAPLAVTPGTIAINVPAELFPELVMWARKLKLPKNWNEAAKLKAIVDFQVHLNSKLQEMSNHG